VSLQQKFKNQVLNRIEVLPNTELKNVLLDTTTIWAHGWLSVEELNVAIDWAIKCHNFISSSWFANKDLKPFKVLPYLVLWGIWLACNTYFKITLFLLTLLNNSTY